MRKDQHVLINCIRADQRAGSFVKILGQIWPALSGICDQFGNRFWPTDRESYDLTQKTQHQKLENLYFSNDLAVPWIMGMLDTGDHNLSLMVRGTSCQRFCERHLSRTVDRVEWFGQGEEIISIDVYNRYGWRSKRSLLTKLVNPI